VKPLLVTKQGIVIGGNMRLRAMRELGIREVWVSVTNAETDRDIFDLALTDNEEFGYYEKEQLVELAAGLGMSPLELSSYYVNLADTTSLDLLIDELGPDEVEEDEVPEPEEIPVSKPGEIYQLGRHRVMCGSATSPTDADKLLSGVSLDLFLTDPPYNVDYEGGTGLKIMNDKFDSADQFLNFLTDSFSIAHAYMKPGATYYIFHADSEGYNFRAAAQQAGFKLRQCLIWVKNSLVLGRQDYQWMHEPILYGWKDGTHSWYGYFDKTTVLDNTVAPEKMTKDQLVELIQNALHDSTVVRHDKPSRNGDHPTMKPVALVARLMKNSSKRGQVVLDSFLGSGSTLMAAEQTDRTCYGFELDPIYVDVIRRRYHKHINGEEDGWEQATPAIS
jgi:DNA modification methylase